MFKEMPERAAQPWHGDDDGEPPRYLKPMLAIKNSNDAKRRLIFFAVAMVPFLGSRWLPAIAWYVLAAFMLVVFILQCIAYFRAFKEASRLNGELESSIKIIDPVVIEKEQAA